MKYTASILGLFLCWGQLQAAPQEALATALADAKTLLPEDAYYTRYLDLTHLDGEERQLYTRMCNLQVNLLSRAPRLYKLRPVAGGSLLALDFQYLETDKAGVARFHSVWERFIDREPYYHQRKEYNETTPATTDAYGRTVAGQTKKSIKSYFADHLNKVDYEALRKLTNSYTPIVEADWFFTMTCVEADRGGIGTGFGYYEFLGIKSRADYFTLIGFTETSFRSQQSELLAVVLKIHSGVAQNDRMIIRRSADDGFAWFTFDFFDNNLGDRDPLAILDPKKGLKHQAERHYGRLPNGLPVMIACTDQGVLQETAPDKIGPDTTARGQDTRIHPAKSCISCHSDGFLRDINDEVRSIYKLDPGRGYNMLTSPVKEEQLRLEAAYLRDFNKKLKADRDEYQAAVRECLSLPLRGADGGELDAVRTSSAEYREAYQKYTLTPITPAYIAIGLGIDRKTFDAKLGAYRGADKLSPHNLNGLSVGREITREAYEQLYPLLQQVTRGVPTP